MSILPASSGYTIVRVYDDGTRFDFPVVAWCFTQTDYSEEVRGEPIVPNIEGYLELASRGELHYPGMDPDDAASVVSRGILAAKAGR